MKHTRGDVIRWMGTTFRVEFVDGANQLHVTRFKGPRILAEFVAPPLGAKGENIENEVISGEELREVRR